MHDLKDTADSKERCGQAALPTSPDALTSQTCLTETDKIAEPTPPTTASSTLKPRAQREKTKGKKRFGHFCVLFVKSMLIVLLSLVVLFLGALMIVQLNSKEFISFVVADLEKRSGWTIETQGARVRVLPIPAVVFKSITITTPQAKIRAAEFIVAPNLFLLAQARVEPEEVTLIRPSYTGGLPPAFTSLLTKKQSAPTKASSSLNLTSFIPKHCRVRILDGRIDATTHDQSTLIVLRRFDVDVSMFSLPIILENSLLTDLTNRITGSVSFERLYLRHKELSLTLSGFTLSGNVGLEKPLQNCKLTLQMKSETNLARMTMASDWQLIGSRNGITVHSNLNGTVLFDSALIPFDLGGTISTILPTQHLSYAAMLPKDLTQSYHVRLFHLGLGADSAALDAVVTPKTDNGPSITGRLSITRVSLTRWLGFARGLCPGLQIALDEITEGIIDFTLDSKGLVVPHVSAIAKDFSFSGKGGVASWKKPVVFLDMQSAFVDLGIAIPESVGVLYNAPVYQHKPLTNMTQRDYWPTQVSDPPHFASDPNGSPQKVRGLVLAPNNQKADKAQSPSKTKPVQTTSKAAVQEEGFHIGYDIRLGAKDIHYGLIDIENGHVIISPGQTKKGIKGVKIAAKTDLYNGKLQGHAILYGQSQYEIDLDIDNVRASRLRKDITFLPVSRGLLSSTLFVQSAGTKIDDFLQALRGTVRATIRGGSFALKNEYLAPIHQSNITLNLHSAAFQRSSLGLQGRWQVEHHGNGWQADLDCKGMMWFGGEGKNAGLNCNNVPFTLNADNLAALAPFIKEKDVDLDLKGEFSFTQRNQTISVRNGIAKTEGLSATFSSGECDISRSLPDSTIQLSKANADLPQVAKLFGFTISKLPEKFHAMQLTQGKFTSIGDDKVALQAMKATLDQSHLSGDISLALQKIPALAFDLHIDTVNFDNLMGKEDKDKHKTNATEKKTAAPKTSTPWDLRVMKEFSASGHVRLDHLTVAKLHFTHLSTPVTLQGGHLTLPKIKGFLYGGLLQADANASFDRGVNFTGHMTIQHFDLASLMRDRKVKGIFTGKTDFQAHVSANLSASNQLLSHLNGQVGFQVNSGSFQSVDKEGNPKGEPTVFRHTGGNASLRGGILQTSNLNLKGDELTLHSEGWIDLDKERLDLEVVADMPRLPQIPMRVHGTFDKPETDIKGGMVILNTVGGLFKGLFGLVGGLASSVVNLFQ